ncbi:MAG: hypothetical protein IKX51_06755, partial [Bacteroidales bacterium]|nr:hypothetical protein [Bacteroidales bacterium]
DIKKLTAEKNEQEKYLRSLDVEQERIEDHIKLMHNQINQHRQDFSENRGIDRSSVGFRVAVIVLIILIVIAAIWLFIMFTKEPTVVNH